MGHTPTGVFEQEAEETVNDLLRYHEVSEDVAEEARKHCERGDPIRALDVFVRNR